MPYPDHSSFRSLGFYLLAVTLWACQGNSVETIEVATLESPEVEPVIVYDASDSLLMGLNVFNLDSVLKNASFAYLIYDATTDSIIAERNPDLSLVPASTIKLFTTAAALELLGPGAHFGTRLLYDGEIENRILKGNLIIKGGGDPTFCIGEQTMNKVFAAWGSSVAQLNIDSITGDIIGDARIFSEDFIPYTWTWGEINLGYSAAPSGLSFNGNLFRLVFDPNSKDLIIPQAGDLALTHPNSAYLNQTAIYDADDELYLVGFPNSSEKKIRGTVREGTTKAEVVGVIHDPALLAATLFKKKLMDKGIHVSGVARSTLATDSLRARDTSQTRHQIAAVGSPSVDSMVYSVNHHSNNFMAETLLKHLGVKKKGYGSTEAGVEAVYSFMKSKSIDVSGFYMFDGSGISRFNAITVNQLVQLLKYMQHSPDSAAFISSLAVAGQSGTLSKMCLDSEAMGNIQGKSGTMSRVKSYAGYAKSRSGHTLIFAIIVNNFNCSSVEMRSKIENILNLMATM
ncbi:MAG: D-alanyl-D-alanine carboxypeptidase/D-alanyl-D-alanine-endopeptidase [Lentimicrobium sp.]|jgi:D-alanyl-D-alanine carboxypeptidase/D-alanyl-D-alanine-endopeptidase (penicillin-binding protein 4)|nr:D-alanyl-D-alanine carboxypeptidase/D-alanyl-D-alanine-endopeptidase [Lentimicrobium sp.]MDD2528179.1 D-alanyl-D-alanine carboxypeptidase/D-alanyl-D-alanine-endopeptidase [Lentimicrobiaceae bacterium]MDD4596863.1 D-alanyl-D-alanine carboxypeptidase/D-alanyl-D-alanine-endopeptidase [Lentimicrobiaceae bacterium]